MTLDPACSNFALLATDQDISLRIRRLMPTKRPRRVLLGLVILITLLTAVPAWAATITVDSGADNETASDGACTLREAINNANANGDTTDGDCTSGSGPDLIHFSIVGPSPIEIEHHFGA